MKKLSLLLITISTVTLAMAQPGKTGPAKGPTGPVCKNLNDSASYAIGLSMANFYKQQGIKNINVNLLNKAINDVMGNKTLVFDENVANNVMNNYIMQMQSQKSKPRIDSGAAFMAKNKLRKEVKTTASGLQYEVITEGTGAKPTANDSVTCNYRGALLNGEEFDNSFKRGQPITFSLRGVIAGWTEGLQLMSVGSKYKFYIPYNLAYGPTDYGPIPGGSTLVFEIELLDVRKGQ